MDILESLKILTGKISEELSQKDDMDQTKAHEGLYDEIESMADQIDSLSLRIAAIDSSVTRLGDDIKQSVLEIEKANSTKFSNIEIRLTFLESDFYDKKYKISLKEKIIQSASSFFDSGGIIPLMCALTGLAGAGICWVILTYFI